MDEHREDGSAEPTDAPRDAAAEEASVADDGSPGGAGSDDHAHDHGDDERPWSGWGSFAEIQDTVSGLVDSALKNVAPATGRFPRYDLVDVHEEGYVILFDMPGLAKGDVEVSAANGELTVEGTRSRPTLPDGAEVQRSERTFGRFRRSVRVPADIDVGSVRARMENGVLEVRLPRRVADDAQKINVD